LILFFIDFSEDSVFEDMRELDLVEHEENDKEI
jgi:hypothetical protein